jgi:aminoglycoside phosphotransferase (APT) family kinase protein
MIAPTARAKIEAALEAWKRSTELLSCSALAGGISADPYLLSVRFKNGQTGQLIARFIGDYAKSLGSDSARNQFRILQFVRAAGLPSPEALYLPDEQEEPFFLMSFLDGAPTANPQDPQAYIRDFAHQLAKVHQTPLTPEMENLLPKPELPWKPWREALNSDLREPEVVQAILNFPTSHKNPYVLRHGDFWPGNVLCQQGKITGIIDWEEACLGDPLADLAISRLDIWWILGREAAEDFTACYLDYNPLDTFDLTYWDLRTSLRPMANLEDWVGSYASLGRPDITFEGMRRDLLDCTDLALKSAKG